MTKSRSVGIGGLLAVAAIGGILVFLFSQGYLEYKSGPDLRITRAAATTGQWANYDMSFDVVVFNQGNKVAENCQVFFDYDINDSSIDGEQSGSFSVIPDDSYTVSFRNVQYSQDGDYVYSASVKCQNHPLSNPVSYAISIQSP